MTTLTEQPPAWFMGSLALRLDLMTNEMADAYRNYYSLPVKDYQTGASSVVPFHHSDGGWLHLPRCSFYELGPHIQNLMQNGTSDGNSLPLRIGVNTTFGMTPYPADQPKFIDDIVQGCKRTGHGGLAVAPTRSGKTLCAIEAACRLGGSTLIILDQGILLDQWKEAIEKWVGVECGVIRRGQFDYEPRFPFVVGMAQTLIRRQLSEEVRRSFRTVIVDECQIVPARTIQATLSRIYAKYVIGLTATPDRADGLTRAIEWLIGPTIATLSRKMEADVVVVGRHWKSKRNIRRGKYLDPIKAEKAMMADKKRVQYIVEQIVQAVRAGRKPLVMVNLVKYGRLLGMHIAQHGIEVGYFMQGDTSKATMAKPVVIATAKQAKKGVDFQPPPTLMMLAGCFSDVRQLAGRALQPQAPCKPMIFDIVDRCRALEKAYARRLEYYVSQGFDFMEA